MRSRRHRAGTHDLDELPGLPRSPHYAGDRHVRLSQLTVPAARALRRPTARPESVTSVRVILGESSAIIDDAQERGLVAQNVVRSLRSRRHGGEAGAGRDATRASSRSASTSRRPTRCAPSSRVATSKRTLAAAAVDRDLYRPARIRAARPALVDVDLKRGELQVRQRADRYNKIGRPKSEAGERTVPLPPMVVDALREWKLACPKGELDLVFPNGRGRIKPSLQHRRSRLHSRADRGRRSRPEAGKAKYRGLHSLRHFYASWCINRRVDGGLELPLKMVQARLWSCLDPDDGGHATAICFRAATMRRVGRSREGAFLG